MPASLPSTPESSLPAPWLTPLPEPRVNCIERGGDFAHRVPGGGEVVTDALGGRLVLRLKGGLYRFSVHLFPRVGLAGYLVRMEDQFHMQVTPNYGHLVHRFMGLLSRPNNSLRCAALRGAATRSAARCGAVKVKSERIDRLKVVGKMRAHLCPQRTTFPDLSPRTSPREVSNSRFM